MISRGRFGTVYRAFDTVLKTQAEEREAQLREAEQAGVVYSMASGDQPVGVL